MTKQQQQNLSRFKSRKYDSQSPIRWRRLFYPVIVTAQLLNLFIMCKWTDLRWCLVAQPKNKFISYWIRFYVRHRKDGAVVIIIVLVRQSCPTDSILFSKKGTTFRLLSNADFFLYIFYASQIVVIGHYVYLPGGKKHSATAPDKEESDVARADTLTFQLSSTDISIGGTQQQNKEKRKNNVKQ